MQQNITPAVPPKKRNHFISYIKGYAILCVVLIHLIDWSNIPVNNVGSWFKELLYPGVFFFMSTAGSVVYIAYGKSEVWAKPAWKLFKRGLQLIAIYFLYNVIKFFIYDFSKEPFYWQYTEHGRMTLENILTLQVFSSPIGILLTIGVFIMLSPILLLISKKIKYPNIALSIILLLIVINAYFNNASGVFTDTIFSRNNISFPLALWSIPFVTGYLIAAFGFEEKKKLWAGIFLPLAAVAIYYQLKNGLSLKPSASMYPLKPYYIIASLAFMSILFYLYSWAEKIPFKISKQKLAITRFLGDFTLSIYIWHWIIIDVVLWIFYPQAKLIWLFVPAFLAIYLFVKKSKVKEYIDNQV